MTPPESKISKRRLAARDEGGEEYHAKREQLIRAALTVFQEKGFEAATLNDIASLVGADRATLYYYVGGKEELLREAVEGCMDANLADIERVSRTRKSPREKLRLIVNVIMDSHEQNYPASFVYIRERMDQGESAWAERVSEQTHRLEAITLKVISDGISKGDFRTDIPATLIANAVFGMVNWTHRWFTPGQKWDANQIEVAFCKILFEGLDAR